jgi:hypothetical protein
LFLLMMRTTRWCDALSAKKPELPIKVGMTMLMPLLSGPLFAQVALSVFYKPASTSHPLRVKPHLTRNQMPELQQTF